MHIVVLISLTSLLATKQIPTVSYIRYFAGFFFKILFPIFSAFICHWLFFFSWIAILKYNAYSFYMIIHVFFP